MLEGQGLFQLAARNAASIALSRDKAALHGHSHNAFDRSDSHDRSGQSSIGRITIDANTTIRAMFQAAWEKVHSDDKLMISDDNLKRLEKASKSDNKEIAAERLRQAKAKLRSLRLQAQVAAASGDAKALRRIAQQAAAAAREVASAARGLAEGIVSSATADGSASGSVPATATGTQQGQSAKEGAETQGPEAQGAETQGGETTAQTTGKPEETNTPATAPASGDSLAWGREQLRKLSDETHAAIAQARGIIAFAAQMARALRKHRPDPGEDSDYRQLQQSVNEAEQDLDSTFTAAGQELQDGVGTGGTEGSTDVGTDMVAGVETTALFVQVTTEVTVTANFTV